MNEKTTFFRVNSGAAERTRTFDLLINSQSHYLAMQQRQSLILMPPSIFIKVFKVSLFQLAYSILRTLYLANAAKPL